VSLRVRFAPSPTGALHVGNARTALFNWLFARKGKGIFLLRIEDTDVARSDQASVDTIVSSLKWLGLHWDEGYLKGGDAGPYRQSERLDYYKSVSAQLLASGKAYLCYETEEEMEAAREAWLKSGVKTRHPHRDLAPEERERFEAEGRKPSVRFATDSLTGEVVYEDLVRGVVKVDLAEIRDFNLVKSDGTPMYNFAAVADDHAMRVSHVIRGEDGISNTPRQLLIFQALGWDPPRFGHVSFILGPDGHKLSKRHGGSSIDDLREEGYLPEAVVNYLGLLGLGGHGEGEEIFSLENLVEQFSTEKLVKKSAIFDYGKLDFLNAHYLRLKSKEALRELVQPLLEKSGLSWESESWLDEALDVFKGNAVKLSDFVPQFEHTFGASSPAGIRAEALELVKAYAPAKEAITALKAALEAGFPKTKDEAQAALKAAQKASGVKGKDFFMPARLSITGTEHGPELNRLIPLIGQEECLKRMEFFLKALG
jgi:nondiscriminating glutamyl-tRNA synthetase